MAYPEFWEWFKKFERLDFKSIYDSVPNKNFGLFS